MEKNKQDATNATPIKSEGKKFGWFAIKMFAGTVITTGVFLIVCTFMNIKYNAEMLKLIVGAVSQVTSIVVGAVATKNIRGLPFLNNKEQERDTGDK